MGGLIIKLPYQHNNDEYIWVDKDALVRYDVSSSYFEEYDIVNKIKANAEGYFDFSKNLIDIGACFGCYTVLLDFKHNYCFEPNKKFRAILNTNTLIHDKVDNTEIYDCCLADYAGHVNYNGYCCEGCGGLDDVESTYYCHRHAHEVRTLDSFNLTDVGFIKIDIEGFEEKALRGGIGTIVRNNYPPILFECWDVGYFGMTQEKHDSLFSFLRGLGYEILEYWGDFETHLAIHK